MKNAGYTTKAYNLPERWVKQSSTKSENIHGNSASRTQECQELGQIR